jgi:hypothetical protein
MNEEFWHRLYELTEHGAGPTHSQLLTLFDAAERYPDLHPSFWHPLGFLHIKLHARGVKGLRLHLWPQRQRQAQAPFWPIHDHIFNLRSLILFGTVRNTLYKVTRAETSPYRIYEVRYGGSDSTLNQLTATSELVLPQETSIEEHVAGTTYWIEHTVFHQSMVAEDRPAATLVVTSDHLSLSPRVIGNATAPPIIDVRRRSCSAEDLGSILAECRTLL